MIINPQQPNVDQLIQDVKRGLKALDELMAWARPVLRARMNGRIYDNLRARFDESDVVGETMAQVIESLRSFEGLTEADFLGWLDRIAQNKIRDLARRERAGKRTPKNEHHLDASPDSPDSSVWQPPDPASMPIQRAIHEDEKRRLKDKMTKLSDERRQVIYLRYWEHLKFGEIGAIMGCSEDAAKKLYKRAEDQLRQLMNKEDDE